jgi:hypothetical protein
MEILLTVIVIAIGLTWAILADRRERRLRRYEVPPPVLDLTGFGRTK